MIADALMLSVFFGESLETDGRLASDELMRRLSRRGVAAAVLVRGIEGFGAHRRLHAQRFPDVSIDLPLVAFALDTQERIRALIDDVDAAVPRGLVTLEHARLITGHDIARADFPEGDGRAVTLTVFCEAAERANGRPAYRQAVELLRRHGAGGAIVLAGADGALAGRRRRARLLAPAGQTPVMVISVGEAEILRRALPSLRSVLRHPVVALQRVSQVKHNGELLEEPGVAHPRGGAPPDVWQTVCVYARRNAHVCGRALYSELTRRLRELGAAGATTILGEWGFSGDQAPHGDKLGRIASHRPTLTTYIDRPQKVAELWPMIDELTAEHGLVTSLVVPGYRERAGGREHGSLDAAQQAADAWELRPPAFRAPAVAAPRSPWVRHLDALIAEFTRQRGGRPPIVRVTLADGERFFLLDARDGPSDEWVTLYPYPERAAKMPEAGAPGTSPARAVIVAHTAIAKLELLARAPRGSRAMVTFRR